LRAEHRIILQGGEDLLWRGITHARREFLSTAPATPGERRMALAAVAVSAAIFLALLPFAKRPVGEVWAFIPIYQSAFLVNDLITAALLFGQFSFLKSRALLLLASGYLFTAFMAGAHALTFPGLFASAGLLGAGPHSTAWMYMFWHGGFPLVFIAYALLKDARQTGTEGDGRLRAFSGFAILGSVVAVMLVGCAFTLLATVGQNLLPALMRGNQYAPALPFAVGIVWLLTVIALAVLWRRRPHSVLDIWLMVVMCAWFFDIALSAVFNAGRFDLGFYAGRIYGLAAASFVLIVLLIENGVLYGRLVAAHEGEFRERRRAEEKAIELSAVNKELDAFSYSVSHDLRAPLRAIDGYSRLLEEDSGERLGEEGRRLLGVVRSSAARMGRLIDDLLAFSRLGQQEPSRSMIDMAGLAREIAAELSREFPAARVIVGELPQARGDAALLKQVWSNLIGNALKYSARRERPQIDIGATAQPEEDIYWVRDNGVGFDMRYASKLFGVFQRLHGQDDFPGTGIGLAIVQRVVVRHGGRVWAEAEVDRGACFYFSLPRERRHGAR
jgi:signal transduction histidine kinase